MASSSSAGGGGASSLAAASPTPSPAPVASAAVRAQDSLYAVDEPKVRPRIHKKTARPRATQALLHTTKTCIFTPCVFADAPCLLGGGSWFSRHAFSPRHMFLPPARGPARGQAVDCRVSSCLPVNADTPLILPRRLFEAYKSHVRSHRPVDTANDHPYPCLRHINFRQPQVHQKGQNWPLGRHEDGTRGRPTGTA